MTRGTLFYYEADDKVWSSTEFNGDMYHGTPDEPQGIGDKVIKLMSNLNSIDDFMTVLREINKDYGYEEGNDCYPVDVNAIDEDLRATIKWIDEERPDLKGDHGADPREWEKIPTFKDVRTWQFWGKPNMSDYSYIYNNSGKDLNIKTKSRPMTMIIPDGALGVLNYGAKDCLCMDGKIIDGMGKYKETHNNDLGCFTVEVTCVAPGKYDVFIAHEGSSGSHYENVSSNDVGRLVAEDIESVAMNR